MVLAKIASVPMLGKAVSLKSNVSWLFIQNLYSVPTSLTCIENKKPPKQKKEELNFTLSHSNEDK